MIQRSNPKWWTKDNDSSWDRVKAAMKRDWDQTKHDVGGKQPDTNQDVNDTVKQASGKQSIPPRGVPNYDTAEPALRFGYGARSQYGKKYSKWTPDLENELKRDWTESNRDVNWDDESRYIRSGWEYKE
ncbi:MAG TPA: hypothetical protein VHB20_10820 [Verrucomicrobiae bacterium]|jgi:hypothetical protein|nr:hypothetical protein [Verrucomicrobiae bacterium]